MPKKLITKKANIGILAAGLIGGFLLGPEMDVEFFYIGPFNVNSGLVAIAAFVVGIVGGWE